MLMFTSLECLILVVIVCVLGLEDMLRMAHRHLLSSKRKTPNVGLPTARTRPTATHEHPTSRPPSLPAANPMTRSPLEL